MPADAARTDPPAELDALVLVPGLLCDGTIWAAQVEALEHDRPVAIADLRGCRSIAAMAERVLGDAPRRFALAGHSMGARVALEVVRQAGGRVTRLALLDTGVHPVRPGEREARHELLDLARREGMAALADRWLPPMLHPDPDRRAAVLPTLRAMVRRMTPAIFADQVAALLGRRDAGPVLPMIRCPLLVGVGREDGWSPVAQHEAIAAAVPHARLAVFEDSGHMAPVEAADAVSAALADWLDAPASLRRAA